MDDGEVVVHEMSDFLSDATEADLRYYEELRAMSRRLRNAVANHPRWQWLAIEAFPALLDIPTWRENDRDSNTYAEALIAENERLRAALVATGCWKEVRFGGGK